MFLVVLYYISVLSLGGALRPCACERRFGKVLNILAFVETATIVSAVKIALAALALICTGFIIFIVMKQSGNSDGMEAMTGSSKSADESETYYGKNAGSRKERLLKILTYVAAGVLAVACIVMIVLQTFIK